MGESSLLETLESLAVIFTAIFVGVGLFHGRNKK